MNIRDSKSLFERLGDMVKGFCLCMVIFAAGFFSRPILAPPLIRIIDDKADRPSSPLPYIETDMDGTKATGEVHPFLNREVR